MGTPYICKELLDLGDERKELLSVPDHDNDFLVLMLKCSPEPCTAHSYWAARERLPPPSVSGTWDGSFQCRRSGCDFIKKFSIAYKIPVLIMNYDDKEIFVHFILFIYKAISTNESTPLSKSNARSHV